MMKKTSNLFRFCSCKARKIKRDNHATNLTFMYEEILRKQSRVTCSEIEYQIEYIDTNDKILRLNNDFTFSNLFGEMKVSRPRLSYCQNNNIEKLLEYKNNVKELEIIEVNGIVII
jgi:hypothetical protein